MSPTMREIEDQLRAIDPAHLAAALLGMLRAGFASDADRAEHVIENFSDSKGRVRDSFFSSFVDQFANRTSPKQPALKPGQESLENRTLMPTVPDRQGKQESALHDLLWRCCTPGLAAHSQLAALGLEDVVLEAAELHRSIFPDRGLQQSFSLNEASPDDRNLAALAAVFTSQSAVIRAAEEIVDHSLVDALVAVSKVIAGTVEELSSEAALGLCFLCSDHSSKKTALAILLAQAISRILGSNQIIIGWNEADMHAAETLLGCRFSPNAELEEQADLIARIFSGLLESMDQSGSDEDGELLDAVARAIDDLTWLSHDAMDGAHSPYVSFAKLFSLRLAAHRRLSGGKSPARQSTLITTLRLIKDVWDTRSTERLAHLEGLDISLLLSTNEDGEVDFDLETGWWNDRNEAYRVQLIAIQIKQLVSEGLTLQAEAMLCIFLVTELELAKRNKGSMAIVSEIRGMGLQTPYRWLPKLAIGLLEIMPERCACARLILRGMRGGVDALHWESTRKVAEQNLIELLGKPLWLSLPNEMKSCFREREREWLDAQKSGQNIDFGHLCMAYFKPFEIELLNRVRSVLHPSTKDGINNSEELDWCKNNIKYFDIERLNSEAALRLLKRVRSRKVPESIASLIESKFPGLSTNSGSNAVEALFQLKERRNSATHDSFSKNDLMNARDEFFSPSNVKAIKDLFY